MRAVVALVLASLVAVACGDAEPDSATQEPEVQPTTSEPSMSPATTEPPAAPSQPPSAALPVSDGVRRAPADPDAGVAELAAGWNDAGFDLLRRLAADDNVVFSPASIGHALLMAAAAGDESTRAAIESAFKLPDNPHAAWNALDHALDEAQSDSVTVTMTDRIWPRVGTEPDQEWIDLLVAQHGADVVPLDVVDEPAASREIVNDWVRDRTEGLIPSLLPEGFLGAQTALVLTNTVYFAADWARPFGKSEPVDGTFTTLRGTEVDVSFMRELELADRRGIGDGFAGAEIPYAGGDYSMLILVPDAGRFDELIDRLDQDLLDEIDRSFTSGPFELLLPTWSTTHQINLTDWLDHIGASPGSYPKISPDAHLDAAIHAADITVDEQGTVAAAATAVAFPDSGPPEPELTVAADRPFIYLIRHRDSGLVLFAGQVTDPT